MSGDRRRSACFLDRDGTIIVDRHYLSDPDEVEMAAGAFDGLRFLQDAGFPLVVITNQSGIARGYLSPSDVVAVNGRLTERLAAAGIEIAGWYVCPHGPDDGCECRKPKAGLAIWAIEDLGLRGDGSYVIGDKGSDVEVAERIGATGILLVAGTGGIRRVDDRLVCGTLRDAGRWIVERARFRHQGAPRGLRGT